MDGRSQGEHLNQVTMKGGIEAVDASSFGFVRSGMK